MTELNSAAQTHFRADSRQSVSLQGVLQASELSGPREVQVVDLGLGGARLEASEALEPGATVELLIEAPHLWDPLTLRGRVAWTEPSLAGTAAAGVYLGVCFEHEDGASVRKLTELLEAEAFT